MSDISDHATVGGVEEHSLRNRICMSSHCVF